MTDIDKLNEDIATYNSDVLFILNKFKHTFGINATVEPVKIQNIQGFGSYRLSYINNVKYHIKQSYNQLEQVLDSLHMKVPNLLLNRDVESIFVNTKKIKSQIERY